MKISVSKIKSAPSNAATYIRNLLEEVDFIHLQVNSMIDENSKSVHPDQKP